VQVLLLAREMGVLKMGTVALDGTKIHANASRHSALSYEHAGKIEAQLKAEVADLMAKAEAADQADMSRRDVDPRRTGAARGAFAKIAERARRSRRAPRSAMRASRPSMKPSWRRARPRREGDRQEARRQAAAPPVRGAAAETIRSI
jgi:hypothetical protein